jgi:SPASM domain peptide maturase of grasp-with-spasm system
MPVKGSKRAVVCDLQRNIIQPIPLLIFEYLEQLKKIDLPEVLLDSYSKTERNTIEEYINFLYHNEFGYFSTSHAVSINPVMPDFEEKSQVTNAIVDFNQNSTHSLESVVTQLSDLGCKAIEIRYFFHIEMDIICNALQIIHKSNLEKSEFLIQKSDEFSWERLIQLKNEYPKLSKVTISNSSDNIIYKHEDLVVIYTTEIIRNETKCGVTGELYCIADSRLFWESRHFNNCLYKKISVDKSGNIRNCPSMAESFGNISNTSLVEVVENELYRKFWTITKDVIEVCSECELRYVCQDCRAYTIHMNNPFSKPLKCRYNPIE